MGAWRATLGLQPAGGGRGGQRVAALGPRPGLRESRNQRDGPTLSYPLHFISLVALSHIIRSRRSAPGRCRTRKPAGSGCRGRPG